MFVKGFVWELTYRIGKLALRTKTEEAHVSHPGIHFAVRYEVLARGSLGGKGAAI